MKIEVVECAINQPSIVLEDIQYGEVQKVYTTMLPMIHKDQDELVLIPQIDFVILEDLMWWNARFFISLCSQR